MSLRPAHLLRELRRRRVVHVIAVYAAVAWLVIEVSATAFPYLSLPEWSVTLVIVLLLAGFPFAIILAWAYDLTPEGVKRTLPAEVEGSSGARRRPSRAGAAAVILALLLGAYLYADRRDAAAGAGAATYRSIAVLPFVNMTADPDNEYFSDGLTEELLNVLAQVEGLRVAARTSAFAFKGAREDVTEIGRRLNVETVLEGSVRRTGDRLRITAQLISAADGYHIWSQTFEDTDRADIFVVQDEISRAIVKHLLPRFQVPAEALAAHVTTTDVQAHEEYLKGRYAFWQGATENNLRNAIRHYEAAIERDPGYALAYAGLSDAWMLLGGQHAAPREVFPQAKAAALRALELDDQLAEGYIALASINWFYDWDWQSAERNYRRSFSVNRAVYTRCICYAWYLAVLGDLDAAVSEGERARTLDPVGHLPLTTLAQIYYLAGRHHEARAALRALEQAGVTSALIPRLTAWLAWDEGGRAEAVSVLESFVESFGSVERFAGTAPPIAVAELGYMYAGVGRMGEARALATLLRERAGQRYVPPELVASAVAAAGDVAEAAEWVARAHHGRSNLAMFTAYPISRALADVPRYREVLSIVGVPYRRIDVTGTGTD
jgi:adenylate cyclase